MIESLQALEAQYSKPAFVAISGFGGSGKSRLAEAVSNEIEGSAIVPIDDFIVGARDERSGNWRTFDRDRLKSEVLEKATIGYQLRYQKI